MSRFEFGVSNSLPYATRLLWVVLCFESKKLADFVEKAVVNHLADTSVQQRAEDRHRAGQSKDVALRFGQVGVNEERLH
ncbi:hypothetical protein SLS57_001454 [Botryosphaeria dothidea]